MHRMPRQRCNEAARRALRAAWPRLDVLPVEPVVAFVSVRRCLSISAMPPAIVASSDPCGSACITNACFMRSRCTSMPQKRKCGMRRRFAKQCLHAGFYSLKVLTGYGSRPDHDPAHPAEYAWLRRHSPPHERASRGSRSRSTLGHAPHALCGLCVCPLTRL